MNFENINNWLIFAIKAIATIIMLLNFNKIWRGFLKAFGSDGLDKKELAGIGLFILAVYMLNREYLFKILGHPGQLYSDWVYGIVIIGAMLGLGLNSILTAIKTIVSIKGGNQVEHCHPEKKEEHEIG